ncbi:MAG: hypothetical protein K2X77_31120 [Candidatus Obscuribacterales bacterium]|jgi:hypothetical protein|nr:hypothetical protein [Candidatus Obscuribacterales bacterium]
MSTFDLIEYQHLARNSHSSKELFELWEEVCRNYDKGLIGKYQLEEMKAVIWPGLKAMRSLEVSVDTVFQHHRRVYKEAS